MDKVRAMIRKNSMLLLVGGAAAGSTAGAQAVATTIDYGTFVNAVSSGSTTTINNAGPALFGFIALIGGFYFVWGRVRSLW